MTMVTNLYMNIYLFHIYVHMAPTRIYISARAHAYSGTGTYVYVYVIVGALERRKLISD